MIKAILNSLFKKKLSIIFIIIQLSTINYMIFQLFTNFNVVEKQKKEVINIIGDNSINLIQLNFKNVYPVQGFADKMFEIDKYLTSLDDVKSSGGFFETNYIFNELKDNDIYLNMYRRVYKGTPKEAYPYATDSLILDKGMDNLINLRVQEGRSFSENDFYLSGDTPIPILVGAEFKGIVNIGDSFNTNNLFGGAEHRKFVVVGILNDASYCINGNYIANEKTNLSTYFIIPTYDGMQNNIMAATSKQSSYFIVAKEKSYIKNIISKIDSQGKSIGLDLQATSFEDTIANYKKENSEIFNIITITIVFLIVFTLFSLITTILSSIEKRKYEFGVRIVTGSSIFYLKKLVFGELAFITLTSYIISLLYIIYDQYKLQKYFYQRNFDLAIVMNIKVILPTLLLISLITLLSSYYPLKKLEKLQPNEIIGGFY